MIEMGVFHNGMDGWGIGVGCEGQFVVFLSLLISMAIRFLIGRDWEPKPDCKPRSCLFLLLLYN